MTVFELLSEGYGRRALLEVLIVGVLCGAVGVHVVLRHLSFPTMALTHATFPGVVIAALLGMNIVIGAGLFGLLLVGIIAVVAGSRVTPAGTSGRTGGTSADTGGRDVTSVTGILLAGGFALGVALMSAQDGFTRDLTAYLVGSILTVHVTDIVVSAVTAVVVLTVLAALRKELMLGAFDPSALAAAGYPTRRLDVVMLVAIEVTVVTSVPAVGTILAVALIVGPAVSARLWCSSAASMTVVAIVIAVTSGVLGLVASELWRVAAGGATVLTVAAFFTVSLFLGPAVRARLHRPGTLPAAQPPAPAAPLATAG